MTIAIIHSAFDDLHGSGIPCRCFLPTRSLGNLLGIGARHSLLLALESDDDEGGNFDDGSNFYKFLQSDLV